MSYLAWQSKRKAHSARMGNELATRNTGNNDTDVSMTNLALTQTEEQIDQWLSAHPLTVKVKGVERKVERKLTLSAQVPTSLYISTVQYAYNEIAGSHAPDGSVDLASGMLGRAVRRPLFVAYAGISPEVADQWETDRAAALSANRSERMAAVAAARGESVEAVKAKLSVLEKLRNSTTIMAALAKEDPELAELLSGFDTES